MTMTHAKRIKVINDAHIKCPKCERGMAVARVKNTEFHVIDELKCSCCNEQLEVLFNRYEMICGIRCVSDRKGRLVNMKTTYSNSEVLALLEKDKSLIFINQNIHTGKVYTIKTSNSGFNIELTNEQGNPAMFSIGDIWTKVSKPVSFLEAVNSGRYMKLKQWTSYERFEWVLSNINSKPKTRAIEMINSDWYIDEELI